MTLICRASPDLEQKKLASYRIYSLSKNGQIDRVENYEFNDDSEASRFAQQLLQQMPAVEIWQSTRLVKSVSKSSARATDH